MKLKHGIDRRGFTPLASTHKATTTQLARHSVRTKNSLTGFTLIEVLLVIAILGILAAIVIVAVNPSKQLGEAQDTQRRNDTRAILDAVNQYTLDKNVLPSDFGIPNGDNCQEGGAYVCRAHYSCDGVNLDALIENEEYLVDIPYDPVTATEEITGYRIHETPHHRVGVCAPAVHGEEEIYVVQ